jgi:hypothetical protein
MNSSVVGKTILNVVEVRRISAHGIWLLTTGNQELFIYMVGWVAVGNLRCFLNI